MIRKYHIHKLQTNPWHHEEEPHNHHETPGRQSNQLSLFPIKMIAKLEWAQSNAQQNKKQLQNPTMEVTTNNESATTEPPPAKALGAWMHFTAQRFCCFWSTNMLKSHLLRADNVTLMFVDGYSFVMPSSQAKGIKSTSFHVWYMYATNWKKLYMIQIHQLDWKI